jgi:hypothetical protein
MNDYIQLLTVQGYSQSDHIGDFGYEIPYVYYALRKRGTVHEYVSLVSYDGKFCEAVYELFMTKKNPYKKGNLKESEFAKKGMIPLTATLSRSFVDLENIINKSDVEIKELSDKLFPQFQLVEKKK